MLLSQVVASPQLVIPAQAGIQYAVASRLNIVASGILGRPVKPDDDKLGDEACARAINICWCDFKTPRVLKHTFAISRLDTPELCQKFPCPPVRGRGEAGRPMRPIAACAMGSGKSTHALVRSHRNHPALPAQWFTAYTRSPR
jgi:hypothetical protein